MSDQLLTISALVRTEDGVRVRLSRGDSLPDNVLAEDADRLRNLGHYGEPKPTQEHASDLVAADEGSLREWLDSSKAKVVVEAVGNDPELASRVLQAEREGKDRKTVVEPLEAIVSNESGDEDPNTPPAPPA